MPAEDQVHLLVAPPVDRRAAPAEREDAVDDPLPPLLGRVAERREVGDEADVPEHERDGEVRRDREHVPRQRAAELRPHAGDVRERVQPVEEPRPAHVQQREHARAHDREDRHRLGEAVDARPPLLVHQQQDRGDQRAGVADADPPHEVDDREAPGDRDVDAPDADADVEQPADRRSPGSAAGRSRPGSRSTSRAGAGRSRTTPPIASPTDTRPCLFCTSGCISGSSGSPSGGRVPGGSSAVATSGPLLRHGRDSDSADAARCVSRGIVFSSASRP